MAGLREIKKYLPERLFIPWVVLKMLSPQEFGRLAEHARCLPPKLNSQPSPQSPPPRPYILVLFCTLHHLICPSQKKVGRVAHRSGNKRHYLGEQKIVQQKRHKLTVKTGVPFARGQESRG